VTAEWGQRARVVALWAGAVLCLVVVPAMLPQYPRFVVSLALVNAIAAMGVNLSMGYAGQVSVGHAGFAAIGAYATAILMGRVGLSFWMTLPLAAALAGLMGFLIGLPALRLNPLYIAMVTFGFGQVVGYISLNWIELTNGPNGLTLPPITAGEYAFLPHTFYWVIAAAFVALAWVARNIARSRLGRCFVALRESELAAQAMGVHLAKYKTIAFALGAAYGGVSGSLYAGLAEFVNPDAFVFLVSILYLTMNVVGGMGTLAGPIVGAVIFTVLPEILRPLAEYKEFASGGLLLVFLVFMPRGLVGIASAALRRLPVRVV
jgi:branched-chain amino acid transport system permease protein